MLGVRRGAGPGLPIAPFLYTLRPTTPFLVCASLHLPHGPYAYSLTPQCTWATIPALPWTRVRGGRNDHDHQQRHGRSRHHTSPD